MQSRCPPAGGRDVTLLQIDLHAHAVDLGLDVVEVHGGHLKMTT